MPALQGEETTAFAARIIPPPEGVRCVAGDRALGVCPAEVSRSAVGRAARAAGVLAAKRRVDRVTAALAEDTPLADASRQRELLRTLLLSAAVGDPDDPDAVPDVGELRAITASLLQLEQAGHLEDLRVAAAEKRAREAAARAGARAARRQGLPADAAEAIRRAIEGADA